MRALALAYSLILAPVVGAAQDWSFLDPLMAQSLDIQPGEGPATLFADKADPTTATTGLGFHYFENRSGGNSFSLNVGLFLSDGSNWTFAGPVADLFGIEPRDPAFPPGRIEITTTTLGPNDARCCPSVATRWSVDIATRQVRRLN